jgi:hypothetical protein
MYTGVMLTHDLYLFTTTSRVAKRVSDLMHEGKSAIAILEDITLDSPHYIRLGNVECLKHNVEIIKDGEFYSALDEE